jgi:hypothetical protein
MIPVVAGAAFSLLPYIAIIFTGGVDDSSFFAANDIYNLVAQSLWSFVVGVLIARAIYSAVTFKGSSDIWDLMRDMIAYIVLIYVTPSILVTLIQATGQIVSQISPEIRKFADPSLFNGISIERIGETYDQMNLERAREISIWILKGLNAIYRFTLNTLFAAAPLMIFMGTIIGLDSYREKFFTLLFSVAIWPVVSAILQNLAFHMYKVPGSDFMGNIASLYVYVFLQAIMPFFTLWMVSQAGSKIKNLGMQAATVVNHSVRVLNGDSRK